MTGKAYLQAGDRKIPVWPVQDGSIVSSVFEVTNNTITNIVNRAVLQDRVANDPANYPGAAGTLTGDNPLVLNIVKAARFKIRRKAEAMAIDIGYSVMVNVMLIGGASPIPDAVMSALGDPGPPINLGENFVTVWLEAGSYTFQVISMTNNTAVVGPTGLDIAKAVVEIEFDSTLKRLYAPIEVETGLYIEDPIFAVDGITGPVVALPTPALMGGVTGQNIGTETNSETLQDAYNQAIAFHEGGNPGWGYYAGLIYRRLAEIDIDWVYELEEVEYTEQDTVLTSDYLQPFVGQQAWTGWTITEGNSTLIVPSFVISEAPATYTNVDKFGLAYDHTLGGSDMHQTRDVIHRAEETIRITVPIKPGPQSSKFEVWINGIQVLPTFTPIGNSSLAVVDWLAQDEGTATIELVCGNTLRWWDTPKVQVFTDAPEVTLAADVIFDGNNPPIATLTDFEAEHQALYWEGDFGKQPKEADPWLVHAGADPITFVGGSSPRTYMVQIRDAIGTPLKTITTTL